jgi:sorting nexin-29
LALGKVIRDADLQVRGNVFYESMQILGYADDLDIVGRSLPAITEAFLALKRYGRKMGLIVNKAKTKYMAAGKACIPNMPSSIIVGDYMFERVDSFKYLGSTMMHSNDISEEIRIGLMTANRAYFAVIKLLS